MNRIVSSLTALCVIAGSMTVNTDASSKNTKKSPDWDFNNPQLGTEWSYKAGDSAEKYSLTERGGFLRMRGGSPISEQKGATALVLSPIHLFEAPRLLSIPFVGFCF